MAIDPVCGAHVSPKQAQWLTGHNDRTYYFCSPECRSEFIDDPESYLHPADGGEDVGTERRASIAGKHVDRPASVLGRRPPQS